MGDKVTFIDEEAIDLGFESRPLETTGERVTLTHESYAPVLVYGASEDRVKPLDNLYMVCTNPVAAFNRTMNTGVILIFEARNLDLRRLGMGSVGVEYAVTGVQHSQTSATVNATNANSISSFKEAALKVLDKNNWHPNYELERMIINGFPKHYF